MRNLRPLLRLDDKVAAEGRWLELVGGPSLRWIAPLSVLGAALLHGLLMLLPLAPSHVARPGPSASTDFPLVWRPAIVVQQAAAPVPASRPIPPVAATSHASANGVTPPRRPHRLVLEPVPEPPPDLVLSMLSADVDAIIPAPDELPPSQEIGPPPGAVPDAPVSAIAQVPPVYPPAARSLQAEGRVTLTLFIEPDGSVGHAVVEECSRPGIGFEAAALDAVKRWRYEAAPLQSGTRKVSVTVHFRRQEERP
jgi:protein TonB